MKTSALTLMILLITISLFSCLADNSVGVNIDQSLDDINFRNDFEIGYETIESLSADDTKFISDFKVAHNETDYQLAYDLIFITEFEIAYNENK